jgi:hypothetical protein
MSASTSTTSPSSMVQLARSGPPGRAPFIARPRW